MGSTDGAKELQVSVSNKRDPASKGRRAVEMAQRLRALAALPIGPKLNSSTHMVAHNRYITPVQEDPMSSSGLCRHCTHMMHRHRCCRQNTQTHGEKKIKFKLGNIQLSHLNYFKIHFSGIKSIHTAGRPSPRPSLLFIKNKNKKTQLDSGS